MKLRNKSCLVTGGAGFIGSHLVDKLIELNNNVIVIDNYINGKEENLDQLKESDSLQLIKGDILDKELLKKIIPNVDVIFHQAASKFTVCLKNPERDLDINAKSTLMLLQLAYKNNVDKFLHASTGSVYGEGRIFPQTEDHPVNPVSYYGVSKLAGEKYVNVINKNFNLNTVIMRYFHVYGPRQDYSDKGGVISIFINRILRGLNPKIFGEGTQVRSFTYVKDVVNANIFLCENEKTNGEVFNIASGISVSINELANFISKLLEKKIIPEYFPWKFGEIKKFDVSNKKIIDLGFSFNYDFDKGINETIDWFKNLTFFD